MTKRVVRSIVLLSVYLISICGYSATILSCHCHGLQAVETRCMCHHCHTGYTGEGIAASDMCHCLHSHSTNIALYDISKKVQHIVVLPCTTPYAEPDAARLTADILHAFGRRTQCVRSVQLPPAPWLGTAALRAPPVVA